MKPGVPLYARIVLWLGLNLACLLVLAAVLLGLPFRGSVEALAAGPMGDRAQAIAGQISADLTETGAASLDSVLTRYAEKYGVDVALVLPTPNPDRLGHVAGRPTTLPSAVVKQVLARPGMQQDRGPPPMRGPRDERRDGPPDGPPGGPPDAPPDGRPDAPPRAGPSGGAPQRVFFVRSDSPAGYWVGVRLSPGALSGVSGLPATARAASRFGPAVLLLSTPSLWSAAMLLGAARWLPMLGVLLLFCAVFWYPMVRSITRAIGKLTRTTEQIASGNFAARADVHRSDEIGRLGVAVNQMAGRLDEFVAGQRRFMGDVAHELCSPIARMQMSLDLLERHVESANAEGVARSLADARDESQQMTALANELLAFTRAGLAASVAQENPAIEAVDVAAVVRQVLERERLADRLGDGSIRLEVHHGLSVRAVPEMLARAMSNLLRNAVRYAAPTPGEPIVIRGAEEGGRVVLEVADSGPGVPPEALARLGEPFFRPELARTRETGGTGLGLAIVRSCVAACSGEVTFTNRPPPESGFVATVKLAGT